MIDYRIGDYVGAQHPDLAIETMPVFGKVESWDDGWFVRTGDRELTGPWSEEELWHDPAYHVDYPHWPGTLYDCPVCEAIMETEYDQ